MNNNATKPILAVQYASNSSTSTLRTTENENVQSERTFDFIKIDENHKLVRRYSFDDNGGGYSGL